MLFLLVLVFLVVIMQPNFLSTKNGFVLIPLMLLILWVHHALSLHSLSHDGTHEDTERCVICAVAQQPAEQTTAPPSPLFAPGLAIFLPLIGLYLLFKPVNQNFFRARAPPCSYL